MLNILVVRAKHQKILEKLKTGDCWSKSCLSSPIQNLFFYEKPENALFGGWENIRLHFLHSTFFFLSNKTIKDGEIAP